MGDNKKQINMVADIFNNESLIDNVFENLKKELLEVIFMEEINLFKKVIFIQGIFNYATLILNANQNLSEEKKIMKMNEIINITNLLNDNSLEGISKYIN